MTDITNIKRRLLNAIKRGTGEAYLIVKDNPDIDFSNQIIKGACNIYAYDGQAEGDRAQYVFDIISISNQKEKIRKAVLQALASERNDTWNLTHLFALTKLFAEKQDAEAKQAMYDRFLSDPINGSDWVGADEILKLDKLDGLFYVAEKFGKYIEQNPDDWQDESIITRFQEENTGINAYAELKKKAKTNTFIRIYLENIERTKAGGKRYVKDPIKYKDIVDEVLHSKPFFSFFKCRNLKEDEINQIALRLIDEKVSTNIERLLDIFDVHKFPYDSQLILDFAKQKYTRKNRIAAYATSALKYLKSEGIRDFALNKIQTSKNPIDYLEILVSNYRMEDWKLLSEIAAKTNNEDKIERLARIYAAIYAANKTTKCKEPLEILYNKMNCALHREDIVKILLDNKVLSQKIRNEIQFDCSVETRKLAESLLP